MNSVTLSPEATEEVSRLRPVVCKRGHLNDPYPPNGQCTECNIFLPANPYTLTTETAIEANKRRAAGGKSQEEIAHAVLEDEGVPWDDAPEGMRQLALMFAKSKNLKTYELILQQIGVLKAKPKPGEEQAELKYEIALTAASVGDLKRSLSDLDDVMARRTDMSVR